MKKVTFLLIAIFLLCSSTNAERIRFEQLGFDEGLTQISIRSIYQDEKGVIWVGTNEGLKRYNGNSFTDVSVSEDNHSYLSTIQIICGDKRGHLFLKTNLNNIIEYDLLKGTSRIIHKEQSDEPVVITYGKSNLWVAIKNRIYKYKNEKLTFFKSLPNKKDVISTLCESETGKVYIGTHKSGLYLIDSEGNMSMSLSVKSEIVTIFEDSENRLWLGTYSEGLFLVQNDGERKQFTANRKDNCNISSNYVRAICEDNYKNIWIGTISGLDKYNSKTGEISHFGNSEQKKFRLSHPSVWGLIKDNQGTIWVATFYGGINFFNPVQDTFSFYNFSDINSTTEYPIISKIVEDKDKNLWLGTEGIGLVCFNKESEKVTHYMQGTSSVSRNIIKSLYYDKQKDLLWIGTHLGGLNCLNIKTKKFKYISIDNNNESILAQSIHSIVPHNNYLYLGTLAGIYRYDLMTETIEQEPELKGKFSVIQDLLFDHQNNLWIASNGLYRYDLKTKKIENYHQILKYSNGLSHTMVNDIFIDSSNKIWIGTSGAGVVLLNPRNNKIVEFNQVNSGLESNYVSNIFESKSGGLLVGTNKGFSYIDVKQHRCFNYNLKNGFPLKSMMSGSIYKRDNGELVLGGVNGICIFREESLANSEKNYRIRFDKLLVNNRLVSPNDETGVLKATLPYTKKIVLNYQQKILGIEIASDNYVKKSQPNFQYKLESYDKEWVNFDLKTPISFMNLPSGKYILKVRGTILHDINIENEIELEITVLPPIYATWYAYLTCFVIVLSIVIWIVSFYRSRLLLKTSLIYERKDKEQKELANQSKLRFFTYVSHEFRTPITLIVSQLELLMQSTKISTSQYKDIINIHRNAHKLIRLINELLDFRKQEQGFVKLKVTGGNIVHFMNEIYTSFKEYAFSKKIELRFNSDSEDISIFFDYMQLQKVFYNLISNAFKYTTDKTGIIDIDIKESDDYVIVSIKDNGVGIPKESIDKVFEQFYQADNTQNTYNLGTGLGLALSKGIVDLHGGEIEVKSETGKGSIFSVRLYKGNNHFINNERVEFIEREDLNCKNIIELTENDTAFLQDVAKVQKEVLPNLPTILIVEDDDDLRAVLVQIFSTMYNVLEANNGLTGYLMATENQPNLILSDIMMPEMNGNEMCSKLKSNFETCHIPVILLTAQTAIEQNIDGLKSGADDFISKPFNVKILIMRCNNLLNGRRILQERYSKEIDIAPQNIALNSIDQNFIEKAVKIIENSVLDKKINVDFLCSELAIGRRVFFDKMKSITGQTPNDFILTVKFKIAASMLKNNLEMNISEISDTLGFSSSKYFGKCFKEQFGVSPTQMRDDLLNNKES